MSGSGEVLRAPLVMAPPTACSQRLRPGEAKRCMWRGEEPIGYHLACPGCGFIASYLHSEVGYVEEPLLEGRPFPKRLVGFTSAPRCFRCRRELSIVGRELVATPIEVGRR